MINVLSRSSFFIAPVLFHKSASAKHHVHLLVHRHARTIPSRRLLQQSLSKRLLSCAPVNNNNTSVIKKINDRDSPNAIYIHLPFCAQRCGYCAFTVFVSGRSALPTKDGRFLAGIPDSHASYVDLLCDEITSFFKLYYYNNNYFNHHTTNHQHHESEQKHPLMIKTVYFGGGTPSLIHPMLFQRIMSTLRDNVRLADDVEITCEMDPATFTKDSARAFIESGVNRVSIGIQSFDDDVLSACGRIHRREDITHAMAIMHDLDMCNISLDLICSLPFQTIDSWHTSIKTALAYHPQHISIYDLTLEPDTMFASKYQAGVSPLPSHTTASDMLTTAHAELREAGYDHYEVSNFAKGDAFVSKHNINYWSNRPFFAFGVGATSLVDRFRFQRPTRLSAYVKYVQSLMAMMKTNVTTTQRRSSSSIQDDDDDDQSLIYATLFPQCVRLSPMEEFEDFVINGMRMLQSGIRMKRVRELFGQELEQRLVKAVRKCGHLEDDGLLMVARADDGSVEGIRLSHTGVMIENSIVSDILLEAVWRRPL